MEEIKMIYQLFTIWLPTAWLVGTVGLLLWLVYRMFRAGTPKDDSR